MSISFTKGTSYDGTTIGGGFIYENGPENIGSNLLDTSAKGRACTIISLTAGKTYEAEFYNWNYSGKTVRIGIGIMNTSTSATGSVTILKSAIKTGTSGNTVGSNTTYAFMNSSSSTSVTVPIYSSSNSTQGFASLINTTFTNGQVANGRVRFTVNSGSSLQCKIFFVDNEYDSYWEKRAGWTNKVSSTDLSLSDPVSGTYADHEYSTGLYSYIQRYGSLGTTAETIALGKVVSNVVTEMYNSGEFETPTNTLDFATKGNLGNYGIVYALYGTNSGATKVTFTPTQSGGSNDKYVVKANGTWQIVQASSSITLSGGTSFWFVLPGGAYGGVKIKFSS